MLTMKFFRGARLVPSDIDEQPAQWKEEVKINGKIHTVLTYPRWKGRWLPGNYINMMVSFIKI